MNLALATQAPSFVTPEALTIPRTVGTFHVRCVVDPAERDALFRVRHDVYRVDMGLGADSDDTLPVEQDSYDLRSAHIACFHESGRIAGYVRLIYGSPDLPTLLLYDLRRRYREPSAEVSRLIVAPEFRRSELVSRLVRVMLFHHVQQHALANGIVHLFSFGRPAVFTLLRERATFERIEGARPVNLHLFGKMYRDFFAAGPVVPMRVTLGASAGGPYPTESAPTPS
ncbi:GNAT family N-acyltransferase [Pendulispora albinea]|uniref:GNAT family N-acetyltransferase n=1 Tax=Pendulispora albinea TaxID=2741071 RepID=A0ABZ2LSP6_9BACT